MPRLPALLLALLLAALPARAQDAPLPARPERGETPPVDYRDPAAWMCRPGLQDTACTVAPDAIGSVEPPVDCFYVYPTASADATYFSDLVPDAAERAVVRSHAAPLRARCRVFVPIYHQATIAALKWQLTQTPDAPATDIGIPYRDVLAAWRDYLRHDNRGRGVVLIAHSQASRILQQLIADEIDGQTGGDRPARRLFVAAYLAGNSTLDGGSFRSIAPCRAPDQTGCIVAWSSYRDDHEGPRLFGGAGAGQQPVCVNPAALGGGRGTLKSRLARPAGEPPVLQVAGGISAECVADARGAVLRIRVEPGPDAALLAAALVPSRAGPAWGLHPHDIGLVLGNMLDLIGTQSAAWLASR